MDVRGSVDETIGQAVQELKAGNYRGAVALLEPLLRPLFGPPAKEKLWPQQECDVVMWLSASHRFLEDHKAALPHSQRRLALEQHLHGPRSRQHAVALKVLCMVQRGLKAFPQARKAIAEALGIMDELGLQQDEQYGSMLAMVGDLDMDQGHYKEALAIYDRPRPCWCTTRNGASMGRS
jgi:hypothetical protein